MPELLIDGVLRMTLEAVKNTNAFRKVARNKLEEFSTSLVLIILGIRSGYLFDAFTSNDRIFRNSPLSVFESLLTDLREKIVLCNNIVVLSDALSTDFVFVNVSLLLKRLEARDFPIFVSLETENPTLYFVYQLPSCPEYLTSHLHALHSELTRPRQTSEGQLHPLTVTMPWDNNNPAVAVPLAAILLEYPIAYVPADDASGPFLSNVGLEVFRCSLSNMDQDLAGDTIVPQDHLLSQFSCPKSLVSGVGDIKSQLRIRFGRRVVDVGLAYELNISSGTEQLDRVAL